MLAKAAVVSLFVLLIWGNMVAGLKAGLACPDWPLCHGKIVPPYRWDIYMEFMHRVIGAVASVFIIALSIRRFRAYSAVFKSVPVLTVLLLIIQIFLGGIVVLLELPVDLTTSHFANAMIIFTLVLFQAYYDGYSNIPAVSFSGLNYILLPLSVIIFLQTVLGAFVRHSDAGLACPDFPKCLGYWIPPELAGNVLTHYSHRILAYIILLIFVTIFIYAKLSNKIKYINRDINLIVTLLIFQVILGALIVTTGLRFYLTAVHLSFAVLIFSFTLLTVFRTTGKQKLS